MALQSTKNNQYSQSLLLSNSLHRALKRAFDLSVAVTALVLLSPVILVVAVWIKASSRGPVFFLGDRTGRNGKPFRLYKFRTMTPAPVDTGPGITRNDDPRITNIGRILRKTKLDELPQLLNVVRGEMSLVGPRPEDPRYIGYYTLKQRTVLMVSPGLTSLATIRYRNEEQLLIGDEWERIYVEEIMPDKLEIDQHYLKHWSFGLDLRILLYTLVVLPSLEEDDLL